MGNWYDHRHLNTDIMNQSKRQEHWDNRMIYDATNKDLDYNILYQLWHHKDCLNILDQTDMDTVYGLTRIQHEQAVKTLESLAELL